MPDQVLHPEYDAQAQKVGIVHFGIGAFHRAHQAWYTDRAMAAGDRDWAICGVSLRSPDVAEQLNPQDGLYTLSTQGGSGEELRVVGAVREVLFAPGDPQAVVGRVASPDTRIVTLTVTEKGYARSGGGGLDQTLAERSFYPLLTKGLLQRRAANLPGLTVISCDNLADNGRVLAALMTEYVAAHHPELSSWLVRECRFPATMIDRIVPATSAADKERVEAALGLRDEGVVVAEPFSQWVIENDFAGPVPDWAGQGAQIVPDVAPYEAAKLRMLNGAHSALAYLGLERGHDYVHEAVSDPALSPLIEQLMRREAATSLEPAPGQDLGAYADSLLARFANSALPHKLAQIAMDGSQKIPQRWLATLAWHSRRGEECPAVLTALAAWMRHLRHGGPLVNDPRGDEFRTLWREVGDDGFASALFKQGGAIASDWSPQDAQLNELTRRYCAGQLAANTTEPS
ncbi:mannitol dehydrogenase family protein [Altericroceibacterium xinjiangense]|uniref:mannitol dehydrogenase family protein n=1 Tax=Altericroceibacterium xinjiangense TaxID=762261 RepID=UPI001F493BB2|nr:mannitol dehydrogenase family protein [Altericroceibacterium xinjiangense]